MTAPSIVSVLRMVLFFILLISMNATSVKAQDSVSVSSPNRVGDAPSFPDSIFRFSTKHPIPKKAGLYSACLPGLGQVYNKQYWKAGLVYATAAVCTGFLVSNYQQYQKYNKIYMGMIDNNPNTPNTFENYTVEDVGILRNGYRQYLQYSVLSVTAAYALNILDAFVSAHLRSFDMNKDLSLRAVPLLYNQKLNGMALAITLH